MSEKEYFWLRLQADFFTSKEMKKLRRVAGGEIYTIIYLKMQLLSLQNKGKLIFDGLEATFEDEIALDIDENSDNVKMTVAYLKHAGLLEIISIDEYSMPEAIDNMGVYTSSAQRKARERARKNERTVGKELYTECDNVTPVSQKCHDDRNRNRNININTDIRDVTEVTSLAGQSPALSKKYSEKKERREAAKRVLDFLNQKYQSRFVSDIFVKMIELRLSENLTEQDLRRIVCMKFDEWATNDKMYRHLTPKTIFNKSNCHNYYGQLNHNEI